MPSGHRKILRDNINGLKKPQLKRLIYRAGIPRVSGLVYEKLREISLAYLRKVLKNSVIIMEHARRKTLSEEDVLMAMESLGMSKVYGGGISSKVPKRRKSTSGAKQGAKSAKRSASPSKKAKKSAGKKKSGGKKSAGKKRSASRSPASGVKKAHRYRPGTVALRNIRKQQGKLSDELVFQALPFSRLVHEVIQDFKTDVRVREGALLLLQHALENYLVRFLDAAAVIMFNVAKAKTLSLDIMKATVVANDCPQ